MNIGEIEGATAIIFRSPRSDTSFYVVREKRMDFVEFLNQYSAPHFPGDWQFKQVDGANMDDSQSTFYAVCVADCFDPPVGIVRADSVDEAIDVAVDAFKWLQVESANYGTEEEFQEAIESGIVGISGDGHFYDSEQMNVWEIKPYRIEF